MSDHDWDHLYRCGCCGAKMLDSATCLPCKYRADFNAVVASLGTRIGVVRFGELDVDMLARASAQVPMAHYFTQDAKGTWSCVRCQTGPAEITAGSKKGICPGFSWIMKSPGESDAEVKKRVTVTLMNVRAGDVLRSDGPIRAEISFTPHTPLVCNQTPEPGCPRCGGGEWRAMALVCRHGHGPFVGGAK